MGVRTVASGVAMGVFGVKPPKCGPEVEKSSNCSYKNIFRIDSRFFLVFNMYRKCQGKLTATPRDLRKRRFYGLAFCRDEFCMGCLVHLPGGSEITHVSNSISRILDVWKYI